LKKLTELFNLHDVYISHCYGLSLLPPVRRAQAIRFRGKKRSWLW